MSSLVRHQVFDGIYPEREEPRLKKAERFSAAVGGMLAPWLRPRYRRFQRIVDSVNAVAGETEQLSDAQLPETARNLGQRLRREGYSLDSVARTFAAVPCCSADGWRRWKPVKAKP